MNVCVSVCLSVSVCVFVREIVYVCLCLRTCVRKRKEQDTIMIHASDKSDFISFNFISKVTTQQPM